MAAYQVEVDDQALNPDAKPWQDATLLIEPS